MVTLAKNRLLKTLRGLHRDEGGMEALQVVLITAVAAAILILAYNVFWKDEGAFSIQATVKTVIQNFNSIFTSVN